MDPQIQARFSDEILHSAETRFAAENTTPLVAFESYIYKFERDGQPYILRIGHSLRRSEAMIRGEVDWINFLAEGGAGVAKAVLSAQGNLVEPIDDGQGGHFLATAFEFAKGGSPMREGMWNEALWREYGRTLGRVHALSQQYQPRDSQAVRPQWNDPSVVKTLDWLPADDGEIRAHADALLAHFVSLPQPPDGFGMIHQDAHAGNFFVDDDGQITLFDFDDCIYSWFVYDLAMVLFYAVTNLPEPEAFAQRFFPVFMQGYAEENELDRAWLAEMPYFMKLREIDLYSVILHSVPPEALEGDGWVATYMRGRRERLMADTPYSELDFSQPDWLFAT